MPEQATTHLTGPGGPSAPDPGPATAALILGVVAVGFAVIPILGAIVGITCGILAVVFGVSGRRRARGTSHAGRATAGVVLGAVGLTLSLIVTAAIVAAFVLPSRMEIRPSETKVVELAPIMNPNPGD